MRSLFRVLTSNSGDDKDAEALLRKGMVTVRESWREYRFFSTPATNLVRQLYWPSMIESEFPLETDINRKAYLEQLATSYREGVQILERQAEALDTLSRHANRLILRGLLPELVLQKLNRMSVNAQRTAREFESLPHQNTPENWKDVRLDSSEKQLCLRWLSQKRSNIYAKSGLLYTPNADGTYPVAEVEPDPIDSPPLPDPIEWQLRKDALEHRSEYSIEIYPSCSGHLTFEQRQTLRKAEMEAGRTARLIREAEEEEHRLQQENRVGDSSSHSREDYYMPASSGWYHGESSTPHEADPSSYQRISSTLHQSPPRSAFSSFNEREQSAIRRTALEDHNHFFFDSPPRAHTQRTSEGDQNDSHTHTHLRCHYADIGEAFNDLHPLG